MGEKGEVQSRPFVPQAQGCAGHSDFVVDVRWALGWHLLDDVDRVPIVPTHLLIMGAVVVLCSP